MDDQDRPSFFDLHGRLRRRTYALRVLSVAFPLAALNTALEGAGDPGAAALGALATLAGSLALLPSAVQRLHDVGRSGHWLWLGLIPPLGLLLGLFAFLAPGTPGANNYGLDPRRDAPDLPTPPRPAPEPIISPHGSNRTTPGEWERPPVPPPVRATRAPAPEAATIRQPPPRPVAAQEEGPVPAVVAPPAAPSQRTPAALGPAPLPRAPRIGFDPSRLKARRDAFPKLIFPRPNAAVQPPRTGRNGLKGYKEEDFHDHLLLHFGERFEVRDDLILAVTGGTRAYEPDLVLHDPATRLYLDVEIDEPYNGHTRRPTHCAGDDDLRDDHFASRGWIVVRFPEILVHERPDTCCYLLAAVLAHLLPEYSIPAALRDGPKIPQVDPWDALQAQRWAKERFRERYLGITSFGIREGGEAAFIETLTAAEAAAAAEGAPPLRPATTGTLAVGGDGASTRSPSPPAPSPLALRHAHPRDARLSFDPEEHRYFINGNPDTISVTELIERAFPIFDAPAVAAKVAAKPTSPYFGRPVAEIVAEWKANGDRAAAEGQDLHERIEAHLNGRPVTREDPAFQFFLRFLDDHPELQPLRTEWRIYDEALMVAGTVDALFRRDDGALVMVDWKRTKALKKENPWQTGLGALRHLPDTNYYRYALQQNVYREILRRRYDLRVDEMNLLVLYPGNPSYQMHDVPAMPAETSVVLSR